MNAPEGCELVYERGQWRFKSGWSVGNLLDPKGTVYIRKDIVDALRAQLAAANAERDRLADEVENYRRLLAIYAPSTLGLRPPTPPLVPVSPTSDQPIPCALGISGCTEKHEPAPVASTPPAEKP
jgi:hypothetical protein